MHFMMWLLSSWIGCVKHSPICRLVEESIGITILTSLVFSHYRFECQCYPFLCNHWVIAKHLKQRHCFRQKSWDSVKLEKTFMKVITHWKSQMMRKTVMKKRAKKRTKSRMERRWRKGTFAHVANDDLCHTCHCREHFRFVI